MMKFALADENTNDLWLFEVTGLDDLWNDLSSFGDESLSNLVYEEEHAHGVLDGWGEEKDGIWTNGFHSYEIPHDEFPRMIERFRAWFTKNGLTTSKVQISKWDDE